MEKLYAVQAQMRSIGRSALVGTLVGLLSTQAFASGLNDAIKTQDQTTTTTAARRAVSTSVHLTAGTSNSVSDASEVPEAPEVAKAAAPASLDPMIAEAAQDGQALASSPSKSDKKLQRPGMLALGIAGLPLLALGAFYYAYPTKNTSGKLEVGSMFFVPGAAMSGLGFYYAFHKKSK